MDMKTSGTASDGIPNIVYEAPSEGWADGLPIGNGEIGVLVYEEKGVLTWGLAKADIWDSRRTRTSPLTPHRTLLRLIENQDWPALESVRARERQAWATYAHPCTKPAGTVSLKIEGWKFQRQVLSMGSGECRVMGVVHGAPCEVTSWVEASRNILVIRISYQGRRKMAGELILFRETDDFLGLAPMPWISGAINVGLDYRIQRGLAFSLAAVGPRGCRAQMASAPVMTPCVGAAEVKLRFSITRGTSFLRLALETAPAPAKARQKALATLAAARRIVPEDHLGYWANFWSQSGLYLDDVLLHQLSHFWLYQWACTSGGSVAPGLCGYWNQMSRPPWHGSYTDLNQVSMSRPGTRANHPRLERAFLATFRRMLPVVSRETRQAFGINGARYPHNCGPDGHELSYAHMRYGMAVGGLYALLFWDHYRLTADRAFLEKDAWPVMWACWKFYHGYLRRTRSGMLELWPSYSLEQGPGYARNVSFDLAVIRDLADACSEAARQLGRSGLSRRIAAWRRRLPPFPMKNGMIVDSEAALRADYPILHGGPSGIYFPCRGDGVDPAGSRTAVRTLEQLRRKMHPTYATFSWAWLACSMARTGRGAEAMKIVRENVLSAALKFNGFVAAQPYGYPNELIKNSDPLSVTTWTCERNEISYILLEVLSLSLSAVQECLLQDFDGVIRLFPAAQSFKTAAVDRWRAHGGFLISATWHKGKVGHVIKIESPGKSTMILRHPWPGVRARLIPSHPAEPSAKIRGKAGLIEIRFPGRGIWFLCGSDTVKAPSFVLPQHRKEKLSVPLATRLFQPVVGRAVRVWLGKPAASSRQNLS